MNTTDPHNQDRMATTSRLELFRRYRALIGVLSLTFLTYASTFGFGWVYDDLPQIPQNPNLQWSCLGFLFSHQLWASTTAEPGRFYRPLLTLWFLINKSLFGLNPHGFHVTTVLAHVAATGLAYFVARALLRSSGAALFTAAIFGLHPLQTEAASWISSVNDPLAGALCFASFLAYRESRKGRNSAGWWALAGIFFLLALFTKEVSIVLPGIIFVDLLCTSSGEFKSASRFPLIAFAAFSLMTVPWFVLRARALHGVTAASNLPLRPSLLNAPGIFLFDLQRAIFPVGLSPQYQFQLISTVDPQFFLTLFTLLLLFALGYMAAKRNSNLRVAYAWLALPLLPTLNLAWMNEDDFIHDRYMYMSMIGVAVIAASCFRWIRDTFPNFRLVRPLAACLVLILVLTSAVQSQYWANDVSLFARSVNRAPENEWAQLNYGSALSDHGRFAEAVPHYVRSYGLKPGWRAADFAGFSYQQSGDLVQAEQWFNTALKFNPVLAAAWFGLGQIKLSQHLPDRAIPYLKKAIELDSNADGFHYDLGQAYESTFQDSAALEEYKTELQLHPYQAGAAKAIARLQRTSPPER